MILLKKILKFLDTIKKYIESETVRFLKFLSLVDKGHLSWTNIFFILMIYMFSKVEIQVASIQELSAGAVGLLSGLYLYLQKKKINKERDALNNPIISEVTEQIKGIKDLMNTISGKDTVTNNSNNERPSKYDNIPMD